MAVRRTNSKRSTRPTPSPSAPIWRWTLKLGLLAAWLFVAASLVSYDPGDPPGAAVAPSNNPVMNWNGPVGAYLAATGFELLGAGLWMLLLATGVWITMALARKRVTQLGLRLVGIAMLALAVSGFQALFFPNSGSSPQGAGGLIAIASVAELTARFSTLGSSLWLTLLAGVGAIVAFDRWVFLLPAAVWELLAPHFGSAIGYAGETFRARRLARAARRRIRLTDLEDDRRLESVAGPDAAARVAAAADQPRKKKPVKPSRSVVVDDSKDDEDELPGAPQVFDAAEVRAKIANLPVRFANMGAKNASEEPLRDIQNTVDIEDYRFPGIDLLEDPEETYSQEMEQFVREQAESLEKALRMYRIEGEVVGIDSGPVITLYEVRLAPGTKVSQLNAVSSDIARALKAINIRIVANMAGRDTVGVEVPNLKKEKVRLKELMTSSSNADRVTKMRLPMFLGKDASGEPLIEDLAAMPHVLIAGTTGSGKSVCLNTIIMSFLFTKKPNELKLVLIDPKMVELAAFRDIPHLMCPVVTEMSRAAAILEWAVGKMDERYELLAEAGVRDIANYNKLDEEELLERMAPATELQAASIPRKLPYIVFIIDELADMMMTQKEVEGAIVRIAQKARAVGIHLVLATQRPQANVVTGLIKSNMPGRMSFKVASGMDSRIVLDQKGGELLLGAGDMLFLSPRSHKLMRAQGTLVDDRETRRVVRFLREIASPSFERQLVQLRSDGKPEEHEARGMQSALDDPLFEKAVEIVLETKRGSVSLLQRRLAIGYTRASRLVDLMGEVGIIGAYKGTVARQVVVSPEQWEQMRDELRAASAAQPELFNEEPQAPAGPATAEPAPFAPTPEHEVRLEDELIEEEEPETEDDDAVEYEKVDEEEGEEEEEEEEDGEYEYVYVDEEGNPVNEEETDEEEDNAEGELDDEEWEEEAAEDDAGKDEPINIQTSPIASTAPKAPQ